MPRVHLTRGLTRKPTDSDIQEAARVSVLGMRNFVRLESLDPDVIVDVFEERGLLTEEAKGNPALMYRIASKYGPEISRAASLLSRGD